MQEDNVPVGEGTGRHRPTQLKASSQKLSASRIQPAITPPIRQVHHHAQRIPQQEPALRVARQTPEQVQAAQDRHRSHHPRQRRAERSRAAGLAHAQHQQQAATAVNAASVPALASAAISSNRATPANAATSTAVSSVIATGVPVRALTLDKPRGNKPSRDITKKMRLCPYKNASSTVGNAMIATAPITRPPCRGRVRAGSAPTVRDSCQTR